MKPRPRDSINAAKLRESLRWVRKHHGREVAAEHLRFYTLTRLLPCLAARRRVRNWR